MVSRISAQGIAASQFGGTRPRAVTGHGLSPSACSPHLQSVSALHSIPGISLTGLANPASVKTRHELMETSASSERLEIFAVLPVRHLGLKAGDLGILDCQQVFDEART